MGTGRQIQSARLNDAKSQGSVMLEGKGTPSPGHGAVRNSHHLVGGLRNRFPSEDILNECSWKK